MKISKVISKYPSKVSRLYVRLRLILFPFENIDKYIPKKGKMIDVGCGHGIYSLLLANKEKTRNILGYELNPRRVKEANKAAKGIKNIKFYVRDLTKDTALQNCDCIYMIDLLHHIPFNTQKDLLVECYNKLKKGGLLVIKDISDKPKWKYYYNILHDKIMTLNEKLYFKKTKDQKNLLKNIGFKIIEGPKLLKTGKLNPFPHYVIVCKK